MASDGIISVRDFGALGDSSKDDTQAVQAAADACFGPATAPHGINYHQNRVLFFPPGHYKVSTLCLTKLQGARVVGSGRFVTTIESTSSGASVLSTNGAGYCHFEGLHLKAAPGGRCLNLDWDGTSGGAALQSNTFVDLFCEGGSYGVFVANGGFMGSENLFLGCFFIANVVAGLYVNASNSLQQTVLGGNFQGCGEGIWVGAGSVPVISGVGFQQQADYDIRVDNGSQSNGMAISGCRSESTNFLYASVPVTVTSCAHTSGTGTKGDFFHCAGAPSVVSGCFSSHGRIVPKYSARMRVQSCEFNRPDWFYPYQLWWTPHNSMPANVLLENIWTPNGYIVGLRVVSDGIDAPGAGGFKTYAPAVEQIVSNSLVTA